MVRKNCEKFYKDKEKLIDNNKELKSLRFILNKQSYISLKNHRGQEARNRRYRQNGRMVL